MNNATKIRSDLHVVQQAWTFIGDVEMLFLCVKPGEPEAADPASAVVGSLADGADYCAESFGMQLYESGIYVPVQGPSIAFGNFYHSWVSVLIGHSDLDFGSIIIFIQIVGNFEDVGGSVGFSGGQNFDYGRNEALVIWDDGLKALWVSSDFHQVSSLGTSFFDLKLNIGFISLETSSFTVTDRCQVTPPVPRCCQASLKVKFNVNKMLIF